MTFNLGIWYYPALFGEKATNRLRDDLRNLLWCVQHYHNITLLAFGIINNVLLLLNFGLGNTKFGLY